MKRYLVLTKRDGLNYYIRPSDLEFTDSFGDNVIWEADSKEEVYNLIIEDAKKYNYEFNIEEFGEE